MDLFTHVIFAYLLSFVIWGPGAPQYIAAGALAGGLPDADILLAPLAGRIPALEHRGIVHTVLGVTVIAAVGSVLVPHLPYFRPASTLDYFVAMEIGGLSHLALDGFTNFAVHPLRPFSWRQLRLDADVAVNVVMIGLTAITMAVLIAERGHVALTAWIETVWILTGLYGAYLVVRWVARWRARRVARREGFPDAYPSTSPWRWMLVDEQDVPDRYRIRFRPMRLGETRPEAARELSVAKVTGRSGPVGSTQEALERTYLAALAKNRFLSFRSHFGEAVLRGDVYEVVWYAIGMSMFGRTVGVRAEVRRDTGAMSLHSGFIRPAGAPTGGSA